jgi:hypothetical protein
VAFFEYIARFACIALIRMDAPLVGVIYKYQYINICYEIISNSLEVKPSKMDRVGEIVYTLLWHESLTDAGNG